MLDGYSIGDLLRDYTEAKSWSQTELVAALAARAADLGVPAPSQALVSAWMHEARSIAPDHLVMLGDVFGWSRPERQRAFELVAARQAARRAARIAS